MCINVDVINVNVQMYFAARDSQSLACWLNIIEVHKRTSPMMQIQ